MINPITINQSHQNSNIIILLVDDMPLNLEFLSSGLSEEGYKISTANSGKLALERAESFIPDIILLDVMMPKMDGYETCIELKANPVTRDIPVIFLSALTDTVDKLKGFEAGGVDYITKPFDFQEILARIRLHLSLYSLQSKLKETNKELQTAQKELQELNYQLENRVHHHTVQAHDANEARRKSEEKYQTLIENANETIFVVQNGFLKYFNPRTIEITGYPEKELFTTRLDQIIHPDDVRMVHVYDQKKIRGEKAPSIYPFRIINKKGDILWVEMNSIIIEWENKPATLNFLMNITDRKNVEKKLSNYREHLEDLVAERTEELSKFSRAVESSPVSIIITDKDGAIEYSNKKFTDVTGYTLQEAIGQNPRILKSGKQPDIHYKNLWDTILSGKEWRGDLCNIKKSGEIYWEAASISPIKDRNNNITHFVAIKEDITERRQQEAKIRISEERLTQAIKAGGLGMFDLNIETFETIVGDLWYDINDIPRNINNEEKTKLWFSKVHPDDRDRVDAQLKSAIENHDDEISAIEHRYIHSKKGVIWLLITGRIIDRRPDGSGGRKIGFIQDITERKHIEQSLVIQRDLGTNLGVTSELNEALDLFLNAALKIGPFDCGAICYAAPEKKDGNIVVQKGLSPEFSQIIAMQDPQSLHSKILAKENSFFQSYEQFIQTIKPDRDKIANLKKADLRTIAVMPISHEKKTIAVLLVASKRNSFVSEFARQSIETICSQFSGALARIESERQMRLSEERTQHSLKEKEVLLREIHHRVKNNMQVISSLLSLQASKIENKESLDIFIEAESRVLSMAFVHETLYQSDNLSEIKLQIYLENLLDHLFHMYTSRVKHVDIDIDAKEVILGTEQAVTCGLIVTELFTNALKYAIPGDSHLRIKIHACLGTDNNILMTITDNGLGMPSEFNLHSSKTLGLRLVMGLVTDQLEGTLKLEQDKGVCWTITWPVN